MSVQPDLVLAACPACGNPTVKLDHVQKCVGAMRAKLRHLQLMVKHIAVFAEAPHPLTYERAGGDCVCDKCGLEYVEHPKGSEDFLTLLCSGAQVKL